MYVYIILYALQWFQFISYSVSRDSQIIWTNRLPPKVLILCPAQSFCDERARDRGGGGSDESMNRSQKMYPTNNIENILNVRRG